MGVAFAQPSIDLYRRNSTDLFQIPSLMKHSQFFASFRAINSGGAGPVGVRSCKEEVSGSAAVKEADEKDWNFGEVMTAAESDGSSYREKFCE